MKTNSISTQAINDMATIKRIYNIFRYGIGPAARARKKGAKTKRRQEKFDSERWQQGEATAHRQYGSYDEYVSHQASKLDKIEHRLKEVQEEDFKEFSRRFSTCEQLAGARSVLCLGARLGTEVKALHKLGYFAIGIDLNPGKDNSYVLPGDFHHVVFPDASIDAIYTNALDHVFELKKVMQEVFRLLKPNGIFIVDLPPGYEEGFTPGEYEASYWSTIESASNDICEFGSLNLDSQRDVGQQRRDQWFQLVFSKPA